MHQGIQGGGKAARPVEFVQSLERGLAVITTFDREHPQMTLSEVAERTGLTRAAARRFLITLRELGYVREEGRRFSLKPKALDLGYAYLSSTPVADIALEHLREAAEDLQESCSASALEGTDIVYIARATAARRIMSLNLSIGSRLPAAFTAMGRVLLADLPVAEVHALLDAAETLPPAQRSSSERAALIAEIERVREQGFALIDQEREVGIRSVAVPVRDNSGRAIVAINAAVNASRVEVTTLRTRHLDRLVVAKERIEADLARRG